jgi:cytidine deaminase
VSRRTILTEEDLVKLALAARDRAYAPYSHYQVGAVIATESGEVFAGANIENASYGLSVCAERNAVTRMILDGGKRPRVIVVATQSSPPGSPCGMCRQVLLEFADDPEALRVICVNPEGERAEWSLAELIPAGFTGKQLG